MRAPQVHGVDTFVNGNEMAALFEAAGPIVQTVTLSPAAADPAAVLVFFATPAAAAQAIALFDGHFHAGTFLEVKPTDGAAAAAALAALVQQVAALPISPGLSRDEQLERRVQQARAAAEAAGSIKQHLKDSGLAQSLKRLSVRIMCIRGGKAGGAVGAAYLAGTSPAGSVWWWGGAPWAALTLCPLLPPSCPAATEAHKTLKWVMKADWMQDAEPHAPGAEQVPAGVIGRKWG